MTVAVVLLTLLLAAEFFVAPFNLWSGRTMPLYRRFTGMSDTFAHRVLAPVKLATAAILLAGLGWRPATVVGAAAATAICLFYLVRLARPSGRDRTGLMAFSLFGALSVALLAVASVR